jgi:hypothetical protein
MLKPLSCEGDSMLSMKTLLCMVGTAALPVVQSLKIKLD